MNSSDSKKFSRKEPTGDMDYSETLTETPLLSFYLDRWGIWIVIPGNTDEKQYHYGFGDWRMEECSLQYELTEIPRGSL